MAKVPRVRAFAHRFRIMAAINGNAASEIASAVGMDTVHCREILNSLRTLGMLTRERAATAPKRFPFLWRLGADEDRTTMLGEEYAPDAVSISFFKVTEPFRVPTTIANGAHFAGINVESMRRHIKAGRDLVPGCFPIVGYTHSGRHPLPLYRYVPQGGQDDVERPAPKSREQITADYQARVKAAKRLKRIRQERLRALSANASIFHLAQRA